MLLALIFGVGMAVLGYCPGTLAISMGEGSIDAFLGLIGGLIGGLVFAWLWPSMQGLIGPDMGAVALGTVRWVPGAPARELEGRSFARSLPHLARTLQY